MWAVHCADESHPQVEYAVPLGGQGAIPAGTRFAWGAWLTRVTAHTRLGALRWLEATGEA